MILNVNRKKGAEPFKATDLAFGDFKIIDEKQSVEDMKELLVQIVGTENKKVKPKSKKGK